MYNFYISKRGNQWVVVSKKTGKVLGRYPTRKEAVKRLRQIEYWKRNKQNAALSEEQAFIESLNIDEELLK